MWILLLKPEEFLRLFFFLFLGRSSENKMYRIYGISVCFCVLPVLCIMGTIWIIDKRYICNSKYMYFAYKYNVVDLGWQMGWG